MRDLRQSLLDIDDGPDEVERHPRARPGPQYVVPQLAALLVGPGVGALVDRDYELRRLLQEAQELGFSGFHLAPTVSKSSSSPSASRSMARMSALISASVRSGCGL